MECEELLEFEMLEKAAENSFFSQFSLSQSTQSSMLSTLPSRVLHQQQQQQRKQPDLQLNQLDQLWKGQQKQQWKQPEQQWKQPEQQWKHPEQQWKHTEQQWKQTEQQWKQPEQQCEKPDHSEQQSNKTSQRWKQQEQQQMQPEQQKKQESYSSTESDIDLDDTLKGSPSLAKGVEFDDNEAWESISQDPTTLSNSQGSASSAASSDGTFHSLSSPRDYGIQLHPELKSESSINRVSHQHLAEKPIAIETSHLPPPPASALVTKLFPALRKVEEKKTSPLHLPESQERTAKAPSPVSSSGGDSGFIGGCEGGSRLNSVIPPTSVGISEELRQKLGQLELEIERYRKENHNLENLRKEREQVRSTRKTGSL